MPYRTGRGIARSCPRCAETLLAVDGKPGVTWCEKCGGVFADVATSRSVFHTLDRALLEIGFQAALGKPRVAYDDRTLTCPECLIEMAKSRIEAANCGVDACPLHGTWFDTGELVDVIRAFANARKRGVFADRDPSPAGGPSASAEPSADASLLDVLDRFWS